MKNRFKSIVAMDRYGIQYVKNFTIWADGHISLQKWQKDIFGEFKYTDNSTRVKTIRLERR